MALDPGLRARISTAASSPPFSLQGENRGKSDMSDFLEIEEIHKALHKYVRGSKHAVSASRGSGSKRAEASRSARKRVVALGSGSKRAEAGRSAREEMEVGTACGNGVWGISVISAHMAGRGLTGRAPSLLLLLEWCTDPTPSPAIVRPLGSTSCGRVRRRLCQSPSRCPCRWTHSWIFCNSHSSRDLAREMTSTMRRSSSCPHPRPHTPWPHTPWPHTPSRLAPHRLAPHGTHRFTKR